MLRKVADNKLLIDIRNFNDKSKVKKVFINIFYLDKERVIMNKDF